MAKQLEFICIRFILEVTLIGQGERLYCALFEIDVVDLVKALMKTECVSYASCTEINRQWMREHSNNTATRYTVYVVHQCIDGRKQL